MPGKSYALCSHLSQSCDKTPPTHRRARFANQRRGIYPVSSISHDARMRHFRPKAGRERDARQWNRAMQAMQRLIVLSQSEGIKCQEEI